MAGALQNKVAIVTGAGRGIGAATARLLAGEGAKVALASRNQTELTAVADEITQAGGQALAVLTDVSDPAQVQHLFAMAAAAYGPTDILVNNAAVVEVQAFVDIDPAVFDRVMAVNVRGPFLCSQAAFRQMQVAGQGGAIINLSSLSGVRGPEKFPGLSTYVISKYGVMGLTEILAVEGRPHNIRVNCVSPGAVATAMLKKAAPFLKTNTTPEDVARTIFYLADSQQSGHISGANIEIFSNL